MAVTHGPQVIFILITILRDESSYVHTNICFHFQFLLRLRSILLLVEMKIHLASLSLECTE